MKRVSVENIYITILLYFTRIEYSLIKQSHLSLFFLQSSQAVWAFLLDEFCLILFFLLVTDYTAVCSPPMANLVLFLLVLELKLVVSFLALMLDLGGPLCRLPDIKSQIKRAM